MDGQTLPTSIPQVEALILSLYQPSTPDAIARTQSILSKLQGSPQAWTIARHLLDRPDEKVKFFGALTFIIKLNTESASLGRNDANDLLMALIDWYLKSLGAQNGMLVVRKLSSALATFFLHFPHLWRHFVRHLSLCLLCDQARDYSSLQESVDASTVFEQLQPPQIQAVLWVLINVLEDVAKVDLNSANNTGLYDAVLDNLPHSVVLMTRGMESQLTSRHAHEDSIKCLQAWVWFAQRTSSRDSSLVEPLRHLVTGVIRSLTVEQLYDASVELMVDLLSNCSIFLAEAHYDMLSLLFESEWFLERYRLLRQGDFDFDSVRFGQLLLAFGDARVETLMRAGDEQSRGFLSHLCGLLAAQGYPVVEDKIFAPALEFWSTFAETMTDCMYSNEGDGNAWVPSALAYVLEAVSLSWQKIAYPPTEEFASWDSSERVGFHDARKDVIDLLQSVYVLSGPQLVLTFADVLLNALTSSSWLRLEAAAFCLGGLADCIAEDSGCDDALTTIFTSPLLSILRPGQTVVPSRVRQTCVSLIEHYTEYFERNVAQLPLALNLLFAVVGEHLMAAAAAKSILRLCSSCRSHLYPEASAFLDQYEILKVEDRLDCVASERILGGIASVIQAIPSSTQKHAACARLLEFVREDVRRSLELLSSPNAHTISCYVEPCCSYTLLDEDPALHTALRALRGLASIGKGLQVPSESSLDLDGESRAGHRRSPELVSLQKQIVAVIIQVQESFSSNSEVTEMICSILRSGFSEVELGPFVLPPQDVAHFLARNGLSTPRIGLLVSTACSFVSSLEHDGLQHQQELLTKILLWVVGLLKQLPNPETDPELSQNGVDFVGRLVTKRPATLLWLEPREAAEFFFLFTLEVLDGKEPLPKASAAEFWTNFISISRESAEIEGTITQAMEMLGPLLSESLARNFGGNASRSELDKLSEPLKKLVTRYPKAKNWLEAALSHPSFPSDKVSSRDKSVFVKKIVSLRGARTTNQVVREFWLSARGSNFAYAS